MEAEEEEEDGIILVEAVAHRASSLSRIITDATHLARRPACGPAIIFYV
jgi:hypothetical protein